MCPSCGEPGYEPHNHMAPSSRCGESAAPKSPALSRDLQGMAAAADS